MLTLDHMPNIDHYFNMQKFEICGQIILKVIQVFNTVCIVMYIGCSAPVIGSSLYAVVGLRYIDYYTAFLIPALISARVDHISQSPKGEG